MDTHDQEAIAGAEDLRPRKSRARVRAMPGGYLAFLFAASFLTALTAYLGYPLYSAVMSLALWTVVPLLWITDGIVFDGRRVSRTGFLPRLWAKLTGTRDRLKVSDIEQVETVVFPGIKRGRNVYYTYRTTVSGKTARFVFSSGHRGYMSVIRSLLKEVPEDVLDYTSIDLRDYLVAKNDIRRKARESEIPSSEVLDGSFADISLKSHSDSLSSDEAVARANHLRTLANELRVSGRLLQALEAFRRAAILRPRDARLLFEFAECIRSVAGSESNQKLEHRALAMMRLAERHAGDDRDLLTRIGECYFQIGEWRRAAIVFRRAVDAFGESFRVLRGMAELALREGKMAHVIHNFSAANRIAATSALRRWSRTEVDYFSHLNQDEEYFELEISRVNLLETLERTKRSSVRVVLVGFGGILIGLVFGDGLVTNIGWTVAGISLTVWVVALLMLRMLSPRIPFELMETDE